MLQAVYVCIKDESCLEWSKYYHRIVSSESKGIRDGNIHFMLLLFIGYCIELNFRLWVKLINGRVHPSSSYGFYRGNSF